MDQVKEALLRAIQPGRIKEVRIGVSRTAVLAETGDGVRCGLAGTLSTPDLPHDLRPPVFEAGRLNGMGSRELAGLIASDSLMEVSVGLAAVNALLPRDPARWIDLNAEEYIRSSAPEKRVAVVGHFPFVDRLRLERPLDVLELQPRAGDIPAAEAPRVLPQADLVVITGTTLINGTFRGLIDLCRRDAAVLLIGPSTPLAPVLFDFGVTVLSGTIVTRPEETLLGVGQGVTLHQLKAAGQVRLVSMGRG